MVMFNSPQSRVDGMSPRCNHAPRYAQRLRLSYSTLCAQCGFHPREPDTVMEHTRLIVIGHHTKNATGVRDGRLDHPVRHRVAFARPHVAWRCLIR
jgi:hypothetical protein